MAQYTEITTVSQAELCTGEKDRLLLLDSLLVLAKHKRMILGTIAIAAFGSVLYALFLKPLFSASVQVVGSAMADSPMRELSGELGPLSSLAGRDLFMHDPNDLYVAMLHTRAVQDALIRRFDLSELYHTKRRIDTREILTQRTEIVAEKNGTITISVLDRSPQRAADMARAYVEELTKLSQSLETSKAGQLRDFFQKQLEDAGRDLTRAEERLQEAEETTGVIQLDAQAKATIESIEKLRAAIVGKEVELRGMRQFATAQNPQLMRSQEELAAMRSQLAALEAKSSRPNSRVAGSAGNLPAAGLEYIRRMREVKYYEAVYEILGKQLEAAKLDEAKNIRLIAVLDPAEIPEQKSRPKRAVLVIELTMAAAFLVVGLAFSCEAYQRARSDPRVFERLVLLRAYLFSHHPAQRL